MLALISFLCYTPRVHSSLEVRGAFMHEQDACQSSAVGLVCMLITVPGAKVPREVPPCGWVMRQLMLRLTVMDRLGCWHFLLSLRTSLQETPSEEPIRTVWMSKIQLYCLQLPVLARVQSHSTEQGTVLASHPGWEMQQAGRRVINCNNYLSW